MSDSAQAMTCKSVSDNYLLSAVEANFSDRPAESYGIDLSILIPAALEILTMLLQDCWMKPTPSQLAARLRNADRDAFVRIAIRDAVRKACRNQQIKVPDPVEGRIRAGIRTGFEVMSHADRQAMCVAATALAYGEGA